MRSPLTPRAEVEPSSRPSVHLRSGPSSNHSAFGVQPLEPRVLMSVTGETTITPVLPSDDAFVRDGTYAGVNAGASAALVVKRDARSYSRDSYLTFDLGAIDESVDKALLRLYGRYEGPKTIPIG